MNTIKLKVYILADEYADDGWSVQTVAEGTYNYYEHKDDAYHLDTIEIPQPTAEDLIKIADVKAEKLEAAITTLRAEAEERLAEFKSKFLLLNAS